MKIRLTTLILVICCLPATTLTAAPAKVRSGEHQGFSRLVIESAAAGEWRLRRTPAGYVFRSADTDARFDLGTVFDLIPRTRIKDLRGGSGGALELAVNCECHVAAFATGQQSLVIDVIDGPASANSPFELPDEGSGYMTDGTDPGERAPLTLVPLALPPAEPDRHLDLYWNNGERSAASAALTDEPAAPDAPPPGGRAQDASPETHHAAASSAPPPDESAQPRRAEEMHRTLLEQLSRASSQGLVDFDTTPSRPQRQKPLPQREEIGNDLPTELSVSDDADTIPLHIETSIDRDAPLTEPPRALSADGQICPPDALFAVGDWGDRRPVALQIAAARDGLVGEFDRADMDKVTALAKLYLHIGFGAEARETLAAFGVEGEDAGWLRLLARIEDGEEVLEPSLVTLAGCNGAVALWALFGGAAPLPNSDLNGAAIQRTFSELPLHLRRQLGPRVIERLLAAGATDTATGVRNAILRAGGREEPAVSVASATLDIESGDPAAGLSALEALARGNGPAAEDALVKAIRLRLDRKEAVPPEFAASAGALAYEQRYSARGPEPAALQVLALASTGDFTSAFAAEARWDDTFPADLRAETLLRLFARLASDGDEWSLLHHFFNNRARLMESGPDIVLRLDLAGRLATAGFQDAAADLLRGEAETAARGRLILARGALAAGDPGTALALVSTATSPEAAQLRAEAFVEAGEPEKATDQFLAAGDAEGVARAAWLAGNWPEVGESAPPALASAVRTLGLAATEGPQDAATPDGELATGRKLIDEAKTARGALSDLIGFATTQ